MRAILAVLLLCVASPAFAQQGPWNIFAQPSVAHSRADRVPPPNKRCGYFLRHLRGYNDPSLNLAANWGRKFPATTAHAGAVAMWPHHVALIVEMRGNGRAVVRDNAGTYDRSLRGARFVRA